MFNYQLLSIRTCMCVHMCTCAHVYNTLILTMHTSHLLCCVSIHSGPVAEIVEDELEQEREEEERLTELASTLSLDFSDITEGEEEGEDKGNPPEEAGNASINGGAQEDTTEQQDNGEQETKEEERGDVEKAAAPMTDVSTVCRCLYMYVCQYLYNNKVCLILVCLYMWSYVDGR